MKKRRLNQKGFTMVELIVVIAIIAILAVAGIMAFGQIQERARQNVARSNSSLLAGALNGYNALVTANITDTTTNFTAAAAATLTQAQLVAIFGNNTQDIRAPIFDDVNALRTARTNISYNDGAWVVTPAGAGGTFTLIT